MLLGSAVSFIEYRSAAEVVRFGSIDLAVEVRLALSI